MEYAMKPTVHAPFLSVMALAACNSIYWPSNSRLPGPPPTFSGEGDSTTIAAKVAEFQAALGGSLNAPNAPPAEGGRREINWDGVPPALTDVDTFPDDEVGPALGPVARRPPGRRFFSRSRPGAKALPVVAPESSRSM
jgi:hypothetical protein